MKGKQVTLAHAQQLFAQERETVLVSLPPLKNPTVRVVLNHYWNSMRLIFVNSCAVLPIHFLVCECLEQAICCLFHVYRVQEKQVVAISGSPAVTLRCPYSNLSISLYSIVQEAYPGDVIGINNPGHFAIGDTIFTGSTKVRFPGIPSFSPECFAYMRNPNPSKYKNYRKGLDQVKFETLFSD